MATHFTPEYLAAEHEALKAKLLPGQYIDALNWDALATADGVEDLMRRVAVLKAKRAGDEKAKLN
jgi:hypothetical protein